MKIRIGTRKSRLAMVQTELVKEAVRQSFPGIEVELVPMSTRGDRLLDRSLASFGGKGVFTKELEDALLDGRIDMAVHSAKDMPMDFPAGLGIGAVLMREDARDVLVTLDGTAARDLPPGSVVGTSSLRRELQLKQMNPQVQIKLLRGNVQTRLEKLRQGEYDAIILAAAGLKRLGLSDPEDFFLEYLDMEIFIPAPGQGILAVECKKGYLSDIIAAIHSPETDACLQAERLFLSLMGGGCNAPCGAWCRTADGRLMMDVMYARDGRHPVYKSDACALTEAGTFEDARAMAEHLAARLQYQTVSLVGAGPGDPGLLTRNGLECIRRADVIVYDHLVSLSLLNEASAGAELIYAGKHTGQHCMPQSRINACLVENALAGKYVVRLKGGDPFVFGRGAEEAMALKKYDIPFEIVPGVSSCYSVPAYAGIPVTHRDLASSFHVITGHESINKEMETLDYETLAKEAGTLIFLMGIKNLGRIAAQLIRHGKPEDTPAAVIRQGTTARQKKVLAPLNNIEAAAKQAGIQPPAVLVVGEVAGLSNELDWMVPLPLADKRILVTGSRQLIKEMEEELIPLGAEVIAVSLIENMPLCSERLKKNVEQLNRYGWVVFTSAYGVQLFFRFLNEYGLDLRRLSHLKFAVVGRKTGAELKRYGFCYDFAPSSFTGADLAKEWIPGLDKADRVLLLRAADGNTALSEGLKKEALPFDDVALYESRIDERRRPELNRALSDVDYVVLASGSAAKAFSLLAEPEAAENVKLISIGPTTTGAAREAGLVIAGSAVEYTAAGIAAAILADVIRS